MQGLNLAVNFAIILLQIVRKLFAIFMQLRKEWKRIEISLYQENFDSGKKKLPCFAQCSKGHEEWFYMAP